MSKDLETYLCPFNLEALRCPNAQLRLNQVLNVFINSDLHEMQFITIEPSLERSLKQRIAHLRLPVVLSEEVIEAPITEVELNAWQEDFDEDDYSDVSVIKTFRIKRRLN